MEQRPNFKVFEWVSADVLFYGLSGTFHFLALAAVAAAIAPFRGGSLFLLLGLAVALLPVAALVFILLLIATRRVLVGRLPAAARFPLTEYQALRFRWIFNLMLMVVLWASPFWRLVQHTFLLRQILYWGMGAALPPDATLGTIRITDPFNLSVGRRVVIGDEALIVGHKIEYGVVTLGPVEIEDDALIGGRAILMPGVRIGRGASVATGALVQSGTVIPPGETWAGNPAQRTGMAHRTAPAPARPQASACGASEPGAQAPSQVQPDGADLEDPRLLLVRRVCARVLQRSLGELRPETRLFEELGVTSFQLLDIAMQLEAESGVCVDEASLHGARTVAALARLVHAAPASQGAFGPEVQSHAVA